MGKEQVTCDLCEGTGKLNATGTAPGMEAFRKNAVCYVCYGAGTILIAEKVTCDLCEGTGKLNATGTAPGMDATCYDCDGEGAITKEPCGLCEGTGRLDRKGTAPGMDKTCYSCDGAGTVMPGLRSRRRGYVADGDLFVG